MLLSKTTASAAVRCSCPFTYTAMVAVAVQSRLTVIDPAISSARTSSDAPGLTAADVAGNSLGKVTYRRDRDGTGSGEERSGVGICPLASRACGRARSALSLERRKGHTQDQHQTSRQEQLLRQRLLHMDIPL